MKPAEALRRVQALLARTGSSSEEEARTAAIVACRLIREHRLVLSAPREREETSEYPADTAEDDVLKDALRDIAKGAAQDFIGKVIDRAVNKRRR